MKPLVVRLSDSVSLYYGDCRDVLPPLGPVDAVVGENEPRAKCIHGAWIDEQNCPKCRIMMAELIHREPKNPRKG